MVNTKCGFCQFDEIHLLCRWQHTGKAERLRRNLMDRRHLFVGQTQMITNCARIIFMISKMDQVSFYVHAWAVCAWLR
jgi:translation elongation factor EF-1alpha